MLCNVARWKKGKSKGSSDYDCVLRSASLEWESLVHSLLMLVGGWQTYWLQPGDGWLANSDLFIKEIWLPNLTFRSLFEEMGKKRVCILFWRYDFDYLYLWRQILVYLLVCFSHSFAKCILPIYYIPGALLVPGREKMFWCDQCWN